MGGALSYEHVDAECAASGEKAELLGSLKGLTAGLRCSQTTVKEEYRQWSLLAALLVAVSKGPWLLDEICLP